MRKSSMPQREKMPDGIRPVKPQAGYWRTPKPEERPMLQLQPQLKPGSALAPLRQPTRIPFTERYPVDIISKRFRLERQTSLQDRTGGRWNTRAKRPMRWAAIVFAIGAAVSLWFTFAKGAPLFWLGWFLAGAAFISALATPKRFTIHSYTQGEGLLYSIRLLRRRWFSADFEILDRSGRRVCTMRRKGTQILRRRWTLYDLDGGEGPTLLERKPFIGIMRRLFGKFWGNFSSEYKILFGNKPVGDIIRTGLLARGFRITLNDRVPTLDPKLLATTVAFIDAQDPDRWHPWLH